MAREAALVIGQEVALARTNQGLSVHAAARLAGVAPATQQRVEAGDPAVGITTVCRVAAPLGLKVWGKAFPVVTPALRDTGQLAIAEYLRTAAGTRLSVVLEHGLGNGRAIDAVFMGTDEIIAAEIERLLADLQAQYRRADAKRTELAELHHRPVRLVIVAADTRHNRAVVRDHAALIGSMLPAGSREIMRAIRTSQPLGRDGLLWVRPPREADRARRTPR